MLIIDRIVSQVGRRVDESSPMVDARLRDGSRINAIIPPLAIDGPSLSIRRFGKRRHSIEDLLAKESMSPEMVAMLQAVVKARLNILVSGGTGSGKTTMLNCLSSFVVEQTRLGVPVTEALVDMLRRVPVDDLRLFVVAVKVQTEVGSSLAQIIARLSEIVRTRQRLFAQIRALTAQSRMSGMVVGVLPLVVLAMFSIVEPTYTQMLFLTPPAN